MVKKIINVDSGSTQALYRQIIDSLLNSIRTGKLRVGDKVPSINDIANEYKISRDTVLLAYNELKAKGIISSVPGKGNYVASSNVNFEKKIFLLFDEFNAFKEDLYNSFIETLGGKAQVDIFFHHFNIKVFNSLVRDAIGKYTSFVIMPCMLKGTGEVLSLLPKNVVYLLDQLPVDVDYSYSAIYQPFDEEMYQGLEGGIELLKKYDKLILVYPGGKEPIGFLTGFEGFCKDKGFNYDVLSTLNGQDISKGEVYILPNDRDLVNLVKKVGELKLKLGEDVGLISLNDTPLKEVVEGGVTVISTDFREMGEITAKYVLEGRQGSVKNRSDLIIRNSL